jgi:nitroimidazol reductase NimA-like FMN-containing flavoprotein (pyridoxamine 5'-phosphate oxidase superfamily)
MAKFRLSEKQKRFLESLDMCSIATIDVDGSPHCVPVSYKLLLGRIYVATFSRTKKVRNIRRNPRCCLLVDTGRRGRGRGLMLQGEATLVTKNANYQALKRSIETATGWHLNRWDIGGHRPDSFLKFTPAKAVEIGEL